jgi:hypothetical protein
VRQNLREVHFNPSQRGRQSHAIRPGIQASRKIHHHVGALLDLFLDDSVEEIRARNERPRSLSGKRAGSRNLLSSLPRQPPREGVAKNRVGTITFLCAIKGDPARRIRDVPN